MATSNAKSPKSAAPKGQRKSGAAKPVKRDAKAPAKKGPGVIASIVEFLKAASSTKPLSREALLKKLVARFPQREEESMGRTISAQLGARIQKEQGIKLHSNDDGYWAN